MKKPTISRLCLILCLIFAVCMVFVGCNSSDGELSNDTTVDETTVEEMTEETTAEEATAEETTAEETTAEETTAEETTAEETTAEETTVEETTAEETTAEETTAEETTAEETTAEETTEEETTVEETTANYYTVTFFNKDETFTVFVVEGEAVAEPEVLDEEYETFDGWYTDSKNGEKYNFKTPITSDITLYGRDFVATEKCAAPNVVESIFTQEDRLLVVGYAEKGTTIRVLYSAVDSYSYYCDDGIFYLDVPVSSHSGFIEVYATARGKLASDKVHVGIGSHQGYGVTGVFVGSQGHMHIDYTKNDYLGLLTYSDSLAQHQRRVLEKVQKKISEVSPNTKLIYLIAPNHSTIYPETIPDWMQKMKVPGMLSRLEVMSKVMADSDVTFIDLTDYLRSKKNDGEYDEFRLYNKTDSHWTELGAYYAYEYLMNEVISKDFPAVKAIPLSEFEVFSKDVPGGDLVYWHLRLNTEICRESGVFVRPKTFEFITGYDKPLTVYLADNDLTKKANTYYQENDELPTAVVYRDSYSTNLYNFLPQHFSKIVYNEMHAQSISYAQIALEQPDYVIFECVERHLDYLF